LGPGANVFIAGRSKPIHQYPSLFKGSQPTDAEHLVLNEIERDFLISKKTVIIN
jgi:hypothetical protein